MTTARRRYTYPDRATAEAECERKEAVNLRYRLALEAMFRGEVQWMRGRTYSVAPLELDRCDGGCVLVAFHPTNIDQKASVVIHTPDEIRSWRRTLWNATDAEGRELADLLGRIVMMLH